MIGSHHGPEARRGQLSLYVAIGDSFTAGTGCAAGEAWPERLAAALRARNPSLELPQPRGRGRDQRRGARAARRGDRARARPGDRRLRRQRRPALDPPRRPATRGGWRRSSRRLRDAEPGGADRHRDVARALGLPRARPAHAGPGRGRDRRGSTAPPASVAAAARRPLPRGRRPSGALASRRTSAPTACTPRRSATRAPRAGSPSCCATARNRDRRTERSER